ncbi:hypothetical protein MRB53_040235 [Persea americana]|nr:hypothetical protein MRB53_040235 [Persea americana]
MPRRAQGSASVRNSCSMATASCDDLLDGRLVGARLQVREEQAGEVGVHALVARDELVGEGQARHQAALLQPEDGRERAREEDALHGREGHEAVRKGRRLVRDPAESPVGFAPDAGDCIVRQYGA